MDQTIPQYGTRDSLFKRELAIIAAGILLVLGAVYLTWMLVFRQNEPDVVVRKFVEADRAGRYAEQNALVANAWDASMILSTVQTFRQQSGISPFERYRIADSSVSGNNAQVNVEVTLNPAPVSAFPAAVQLPQTLLVPFHLVRQGDGWKIDPTRTLAGLTGVLMAIGFQQLIPNLQNLLPPGLSPSLTPPPAATVPPTPNPPPPSSTP